MGLNKECYFVAVFFLLFVLFNSECSSIIGGLTDTTSLEEYGNKVAETRNGLRTYVGKHKDEIRKEFGEPHEVSKPSWLSGVEYEEEWGYCYTRGVIMVNFERGCKYFFFNNDIVVAVDAN